jgi:OmpA-OmpF porin, OOP family
MHKKMIPLLVLMAGLAIAPALAMQGGGGEKHDWEAGVYYGFASPDSYGNLKPDSGSLWGLRAGWFMTPRWSFEGSWQWFDTQVGSPSSDASLNSLRGNVLYNFRPGKKFRFFATAGLGRERTDADDLDFNRTDWGYNVGGGGRWYFGKARNFGLRADARWVTVNIGGSVGENQQNYEGTGGLLWSWGGGTPADSDGDHVPDKSDKCAATPKGAIVDPQGCPKDSDGDLVYDGLDKCAGTQKGWKVDAKGCPIDTDGDGVADMVDKCPNTPKELKVNTDGCPVEDQDHDGIWDGADLCPNTPKGVKVDPVGCPMDADHDGVPDGDDKCPDTPKGTPVDATGCPTTPAAPSAPPGGAPGGASGL